jgi:hypothetical protein
MTTQQVRESFLELEEPVPVTDNIKFKQYIDYRPMSNSLDAEIIITMQDIDGFCLLAQSQIIITVEVKKADDDPYTAAAVVSLCNNGVMYLFDEARLELADKTIEQYSNVGHATTILGLLKNEVGYSSTSGLDECWSVDTSNVAADTNLGFKNRRNTLQNTPVGLCEYIIPFSNIFSFGDKIMNGIKAKITLNRVNNNEALYRAAAAEVGQCIIKSLIWRVPYIKPKLAEDMRLKTLLASNIEIPFGFLTKKVRSLPVPQSTDFTWFVNTESEKIEGIVLFFQTTSRNSQTENPAIFSHCSLTNAKVMLNKESYPGIDLRNNYGSGNYKFLYKQFVDFGKKHFGRNIPEISSADFKALYPLVVFDVGNQAERTTGHAVDIEIEAHFSAAVPANTTAYAVIFYNHMMTLRTLGDKKMGIIY